MTTEQRIKNDIALHGFYNGEIPDYVVGANKNSITINAASVLEDEATPRKITMDDVADYYVNYGGFNMSTVRTLGTITGDHRPINNLASECMEWFKHVNIDGFKRACKKKGLTPKF